MAEDMKKPCEPVEKAGKDYNELGIFRYKKNNQTLEAARTLWAFLPAWMAARNMASVDTKYNKRISGLIAENAAIILKAAQEMAEDMKKPCEPVEEAGRDYNELGIFRYKEKNPTLETAQTLWAFLPAWMAARDMASVDAKYNKQISGLIAENTAIVLKVAQEMAGSEPEADE